MTGDEFRAALERIGFTPREAGRSGFFDVSERQIHEWLSERAPVPKVVGRLLLIMKKHKLTVEDIEKLDRN